MNVILVLNSITIGVIVIALFFILFAVKHKIETKLNERFILFTVFLLIVLVTDALGTLSTNAEQYAIYSKIKEFFLLLSGLPFMLLLHEFTGIPRNFHFYAKCVILGLVSLAALLSENGLIYKELLTVSVSNGNGIHFGATPTGILSYTAFLIPAAITLWIISTLSHFLHLLKLEKVHISRMLFVSFIPQVMLMQIACIFVAESSWLFSVFYCASAILFVGPVLIKSRHGLVFTPLFSNGMIKSWQWFDKFKRFGSDIWWATDEQFNVIFASNLLEKVTGFQTAEIEKSCLSDIIAEEDYVAFKNQIESTIQKGDATDLTIITELRIKTRNGKLRWCEIKVSILLDAAGNFAGLLGLLHDTHDKKVSIESKELIIRQFKVLSEGSHNLAIFTTDANGLITFFNSGAEKLLEYTADYLVDNIGALLFFDLEQVELQERRVTDIAAIQLFGFDAIVFFAKNNRSDKANWMLKSSKGNRISVELHISSLYDDRDTVLGYLFVAHKNQTANSMIETLLDIEERFKKLFENSMVGTYRTTPGGEILEVNNAILHMLGYNSIDELRRRDLEHEGFDSIERRKLFKQEIKKNKKIDGFESIWIRKDGTQLFVRESARLIEDMEGNALYYEGLVEDLTKIRQIESYLEENERSYKVLVENAGVLLAELDENGLVTYINSVGERSLGVETHEILSKNIYEFIHPDDYLPMREDAITDFGVIRLRYSKNNWKFFDCKINVVTSKYREQQYIFTGKDVNEEMLIRKALIESEQKFKQLAEASEDGVCIVDAGKIKEINQQFCTLIGMQREEIIGKDFADFISCDESENYSLDELQPDINYKYFLLTSSGDLCPIELTVRFSNNVFFSPTVFTIRNMKKAYEIQRQTEYYHQRLMLLNKITLSVIGEKPLSVMVQEMVNDIRSVFRVDSCIVRIIDGEELLLLASDGVSPDQIQKTLPIGFGIARVMLESKKPVTIYNTEENAETKHIKKFHNNAYEFISYAGAPLLVRDKALGVIGIYSEHTLKYFSEEDLNQLQIAANHIAVAIENQNLYESVSLQKALMEKEIIERHKVEDDLAQALDFTEYIINSIPYTIISLSDRLEVISYNARAIHFTRQDSFFEYQSGNVFTLFPGLSFLKEFFKNALNDNTFVSSIITTANTEGKVLYYNVTLYPMLRQKQAGYILVLEDITEKTKLDQHLIQSEKMMSVAGLAAGMAHEINNPLGTIMQGCQNIERRMSGSMKQNLITAQKLNLDMDLLQQYMLVRQIPDILSTIKEAAGKASEIIKNMLNFSRSTESKRVQEDINVLIERVIHIAENDYDMKKKYDFRKVNITREFAANIPLVNVTTTEIEQVLFNILRNATQAIKNEQNSNKRPAIAIRTKVQAGMLVIEIEDNGPGIPKEYQKRIFEPFFTTKEVGEGTGLGLSVSYMIICTNHHGKLEFETTPGTGTKFIITLPLI